MPSPFPPHRTPNFVWPHGLWPGMGGSAPRSVYVDESSRKTRAGAWNLVGALVLQEPPVVGILADDAYVQHYGQQNQWAAHAADAEGAWTDVSRAIRRQHYEALLLVDGLPPSEAAAARDPHRRVRDLISHSVAQVRGPVRIFWEEATGFSDAHLEGIAQEAERQRLAVLRNGDAGEIPLFFPEILPSVVRKSSTSNDGATSVGLGLVDWFLHAVGRDMTRTDNDWPSSRECGLEVWYDCTKPDRRARTAAFTIGNGRELYPEASYGGTLGVVEPPINNPMEQAANQLHQVAQDGLPEHCSHLADELAKALGVWEQDAADESHRQSLAQAFVRVFDTAPLYASRPSEATRERFLELLRIRRACLSLL